MSAKTFQGLTPQELTPEERDLALISVRNGVAQTEETKRLLEGVSLFLAGDHYHRNRSNLLLRARSNGHVNHIKKAVVNGEAGYVCWWTPRGQQ